MPAFTPTEKRLLRVLSDGLPHVRDELAEVLDDNLTSVITLRVHIRNLRRKLRPAGRDVICEFRATSPRRPLYRLVILVCSDPHDGDFP